MKTKINKEVIAKWFELLDYLIGSLMPDRPNEYDYKEGEYLMKYIKERLAEVIEHYEERKRLPLMNIVFYGDENGGVEVVFRATSELQMLKGFYLSEAAGLIKEAVEKWDHDYLTPQPPIDSKAGVEYSALRKHLKVPEDGAKDGRDE